MASLTQRGLLSRTALRDFVRAIDPDLDLEQDVESLLMDVAEGFISSVIQESCELVHHRHGQMLEVRDLQLHLGRCHRAGTSEYQT